MHIFIPMQYVKSREIFASFNRHAQPMCVAKRLLFRQERINHIQINLLASSCGVQFEYSAQTTGNNQIKRVYLWEPAASADLSCKARHLMINVYIILICQLSKVTRGEVNYYILHHRSHIYGTIYLRAQYFFSVCGFMQIANGFCETEIISKRNADIYRSRWLLYTYNLQMENVDTWFMIVLLLVREAEWFVRISSWDNWAIITKTCNNTNQFNY